MNRRGFLGAILAAAAAPAIVRAQSLMPVKPPAIWTPPPPVWELEGGTYVLFAHPDMYSDVLVATTTAQATLFRGELHSYGMRIIESALPPAPALAQLPPACRPRGVVRDDIHKAVSKLMASRHLR